MPKVTMIHHVNVQTSNRPVEVGHNATGLRWRQSPGAVSNV